MFFLFETLKSRNCWPFYPTGTMSRIHTFEKHKCDRCWHRSAVKNTPPPFFHSQSPPLPPTYLPSQRQLPRANDIGPFGSCDLLGQWRGVPGAQHRQSFLFRVPPLLPSAGKTGSSSGEKCLSLSEGLGKEYMTWRETSIGKTGTQAEGRHVVIRASQG